MKEGQGPESFSVAFSCFFTLLFSCSEGEAVSKLHDECGVLIGILI